MSASTFLPFITACRLMKLLYAQTCKGRKSYPFRNSTDTEFGWLHFWVIAPFLMMIFAFSACSKEVSLEEERLDELSRSWELSNGTLFWELSDEDTLSQCRDYYAHIGISTDKSLNGHLSGFNLLLRQNRTFKLDYSIALQPELQICDGIKYELEFPGGIEKLEGNLQGTFEIYVSPITGLFLGGNLEYITLRSEAGKYYSGKVHLFYCSKSDQENGKCVLDVEFTNLFEPGITARLRLKNS